MGILTEEELFAAAIQTPLAERAAFLDRACGGDASLRAQVESLVAAHDHPDSLLEVPVCNATIEMTPRLTEVPGTVIGPYKLLQQIGEGGMGVVFMAEQTEPIQRTVALKIIKPGMDTRQVIARFEAERQALAMMDHPNIAKVLDAGTTESGRPYFVMELVKGVPITQFCDEKQLPLRERLELLLPVCQAVQHAHQKGVIHRDIKPTNVLVAEYDNHAVPKVIDFGVAKATAQKLTERTMFTEFGQVIGTVEYMSPEQAKLNQLDIDTRSDIYSLGVLLYELLTGSTPFERKRLSEAAFDEMLRIIREEEPPKPSTKLSSGDTLPSVAANRHTEPARLSKDLRGELDWIVMKCLEKDRSRRYESASGLAADLQHHLQDEPVRACPPSAAYRFRKFVRRNKAGVLTGLAVVAALAVGLAVATVGFVRARTEAARSEQVAQFLKDTLRAAGPSVARGRDATMLREILDKTAQRVEKDLQHQPEVQADLWMTLGNTYADLGDYPRAITMYQHAVDNYRLALGNENAKLALALGSLGQSKTISGQAAGKADTELGLQIARKCGDKKVIARCLKFRGQSIGGLVLVREAVPLYREAIELEKEAGDDPVFLANLMRSLGGCLSYPDTLDESESWMRQALALQRQHLDPDHPEIIDNLYMLAQVLVKQNKLEDAETIAREAFELGRKVYPKDHLLRTLHLGLLSSVLTQRDKWQNAEAVLKEAVESSPSNSSYWNLLGALNAQRDNLPTAIEQFTRAVELAPDDALTSMNLAVALIRAGRVEEYRRHCHLFLERSANTQEAHIAEKTAKASLLLPVDGADFDRACELADFAATATGPTWLVPFLQHVKALADYRRRRFASAIDWAERASSSADAAPRCKASAFCIQACCYAELERLELARNALAKADREKFVGGVAELLCREAREVIEKQSAAAQQRPSADKTLPNEVQLPNNSNSISVPPTTKP